MARYMFKLSYSVDGMRGMMKEGAASRRVFVAELAERNGGRLESFDFAFGATDLYTIVELPNQETAAAIATAVGSSGVASIETVVLLSAEQIDEALKLQVGYRPPGQ
jgi:uncharacterized protein with GYD domain